MKIFDWILKRKNSNNPSTATPRSKITVKKALAFTKEVEKLGKFFIFLKNYVQTILNSESEIEEKIKQLISKTKQNLKKDHLIKELWILRYAALHSWFFDLKPPKNQNDVKENIVLINRAFQNVLENNGKSDYLSWLTKGFVEYAGTDKLDFDNLKMFKSKFPEKIAEKIPRIAFECTEGRLGGELHDSVIELIMTTIQRDQKAFELSDDISLTKEEHDSIKKVIDGMKPSEKDFENFIDSLE